MVPARRWRRRAQVATPRTRKPKEEVESTQDAVRRWRTEDRRADLETVAQVRQIVAGRIPDEVDYASGVWAHEFTLHASRGYHSYQVYLMNGYNRWWIGGYGAEHPGDNGWILLDHTSGC